MQFDALFTVHDASNGGVRTRSGGSAETVMPPVNYLVVLIIFRRCASVSVFMITLLFTIVLRSRGRLRIIRRLTPDLSLHRASRTRIF